MSIIRFSIIAALSKTRGIGINNTIPWKLSQDMKRFAAITKGTIDATKQNMVIMGRKTYESFPLKYRPLPNRINVILSRDLGIRSKLELPESVYVFSSIDEALVFTQKAEIRDMIENIFIIGGGQIYREAINLPECFQLLLTEVDTEVQCDTFFPEIPASFKSTSVEEMEEKGQTFRYITYSRGFVSTPSPTPLVFGQHEEYQYLNLIESIMKHGALRIDRTNTGTRSIFGAQMRFSLHDGVLPVLTTKKVFWRGVVEELLWFIKGSTDGKELKEKGIHIWEGNGSRAYLDSIGLTDYKEDELGPIYGFQWRHFNAEYKGCDAEYTNQGVDQLADVIHRIKNNPSDRRIILTAWNPSAIPRMALPPCHCFAQFYVANGYLSCQMYQRSADMGLGVPFNIASYSLLTVLIAHITHLKPGEFIHVIGDAHVYINHEAALYEQLQRKPRPFPTMAIRNESENIEDYKYEDFVLNNYDACPAIKMKMAV